MMQIFVSMQLLRCGLPNSSGAGISKKMSVDHVVQNPPPLMKKSMSFTVCRGMIGVLLSSSSVIPSVQLRDHGDGRAVCKMGAKNVYIREAENGSRFQDTSDSLPRWPPGFAPQIRNSICRLGLALTNLNQIFKSNSGNTPVVHSWRSSSRQRHLSWGYRKHNWYFWGYRKHNNRITGKGGHLMDCTKRQN